MGFMVVLHLVRHGGLGDKVVPSCLIEGLIRYLWVCIDAQEETEVEHALQLLNLEQIVHVLD